jgi:hypothetical protein
MTIHDREALERTVMPRCARAGATSRTRAHGGAVMTDPQTNVRAAERPASEVRETARLELFRLARDTGAQIITRPMFRGEREPAVCDVLGERETTTSTIRSVKPGAAPFRPPDRGRTT